MTKVAEFPTSTEASDLDRSSRFWLPIDYLLILTTCICCYRYSWCAWWWNT